MSHTCPWWFVHSFDNPIRSRFHKPEEMFGEYVHAGMQALDVGCGAGFNTLGLARLVGPDGSVVGVDLQPRMLAMTKRRLAQEGLLERVELIEADADDLELGTRRRFGFAVAFWMVHEVPDKRGLFDQMRRALAEGARLLISEPKLHVSKRAFEASVEAAIRAGFEVRERPKISLSRSVLLARR